MAKHLASAHTYYNANLNLSGCVKLANTVIGACKWCLKFEPGTSACHSRVKAEQELGDAERFKLKSSCFSSASGGPIVRMPTLTSDPRALGTLQAWQQTENSQDPPPCGRSRVPVSSTSARVSSSTSAYDSGGSSGQPHHVPSETPSAESRHTHDSVEAMSALAEGLGLGETGGELEEG